MNRAAPVSHLGRWLTGSRGAERTVKLSAELNRKDLERVRTASGREFSAYRPWMSCHDRLAFFQSSSYAAAGPDAGSLVVSNEASLRFLSDAFGSSAELPLEFLGIARTNGLCVETEDRGRVERIGTAVPAALDWIRLIDDSLAARANELVKEVIPMGMRPPLTARSPYGRGVSSHLYRGGILLDLPEIDENAEVELAINVAHEIGHQALMVYQNADPIIDGDLRAPIYSAIREEYRPAIKSFHALVALAYMKEFAVKASCCPRTPDERRPRLTLRVGQLNDALRVGFAALRDAGVRFTELGGELFAECEEVAMLS